MDKSRVTIKDVAREAGVSVATVSYVLNDRKDQKIGDETRKRILHAVNLLGYQYSQAARTLATGLTQCIGVYFPADGDAFASAYRMRLASALKEELTGRGYHTLLLPEASAHNRVTYADAIVAAGLSQEQFYQLGDSNFIPIVCVDGILDDPLFFQIYDDYEQLAKRATEQLDASEVFFIKSPSGNRKLDAYAERVFGKENVCFYRSYEALASFLKKHKAEKGIAAEPALYELARTLAPDILLADGSGTLGTSMSAKAAKIADCLLLSISRVKGMPHDVKV